METVVKHAAAFSGQLYCSTHHVMHIVDAKIGAKIGNGVWDNPIM